MLGLYTQVRLRWILAVSSALALFAYSVWAFELPAVHGVPWRLLTIAPVALGLGRYGMLLRAGRGEAPEDLVLRDRVLLAAAIVWVALFALSVHAAG